MNNPFRNQSRRTKRIYILIGVCLAVLSLALHITVMITHGGTILLQAVGGLILSVTLIYGIVVALGLLYANSDSYRTIEEKEAEIDRIKEESELALATAKAKADFLVNMSHEIRTPMNAISCATELLLKENHSEASKSYLGILKSSSENLLDVVNDILDFSKIDAGKMSLAESEYDINLLLEDVKNIISVRLAPKPIAFTIEVDPTIPRTLIGDDVRIRQILINLLGNSVKFTTRGLISLNISYERLSKESIDVSFVVKDTGCGIAPSEKDKVFQKFGQAGNRKNGAQGTGLGLTICRELAGMMGGSITFTSELGKGSTFTARVRQKVTSDNTPIADREANRTLSLDFLVWDTNIHYADSIERVVKGLGVSVRRVFRESEAEGILSTVKIDYFLASSDVFKTAADMISRVSPATVPVRLLDIGETVTGDYLSNCLALSKPVDIFSVMELLKESSDRSKFAMNREAEFITPDAHILIVDDNRVNLKVAKALFETFKAKVVDVDSGSEAVELVRSGDRFDLIFMDHMMPGMDGIEASRRIWEIEGEKRTPIVALTANAGGELEKMFFEAGMSDFLSKPIVMKHLSFILQKLLPKDKIIYINREELTSGRKRKGSAPKPFSAEEGLSNVWNDENIFLSVLKVFSEDSGEMLESITNMRPEDAKPVIEQFAAMSRCAGALRLSELLQEAYNVSGMGVTQVYMEILKNISDEYAGAITQIRQYIADTQPPTEDDLLLLSPEEMSAVMGVESEG